MTTETKETTKLNREMEQVKRHQTYQKEKETLKICKVDSDETFEERYRIDNMSTNGVYFVELEDGRPVCTCPDYQTRCSKFVPSLHCKHILAVEDWKGRKTLKKTVVEIEKILKRKFREDQIKQRPGSYGKLLDYLETHSVIERLNEAFGLKWSWEVVKSEILKEQVYCQGRLSVKIEGEVIMKEAFGGKEITKGSNLGDDLKAAASDALKKAATMFGIGLHLYDKSSGGGNGKIQVEIKPLENTKGLNGNGSNGKNGGPKASMRQVRYIKDLYKDLGTEPRVNVAALSRDQASALIERLQRELINRKNKN